MRPHSRQELIHRQSRRSFQRCNIVSLFSFSPSVGSSIHVLGRPIETNQIHPEQDIANLRKISKEENNDDCSPVYVSHSVLISVISQTQLEQTG